VSTRLAPLSALCCAAAALAQTPPAPEAPPARPTLVYSGKPLALAFECTDDDMQWAGMSCSNTEPCPVYLELSSVETAGDRVFAAGNLHSAATTLYSVLLASDDLGKTWTEPAERIRGAGLDQIQFFDPESGWVSGQTLHPLPQDPFLFITRDGGKTWRRQPVFGESRFGSIVQFWFSSKKDGTIVIDRGQATDSARYERYESPNGGDTWMIREAGDQAPRLRRAALNTDWRVRADGPSKSFRIERRQAEKWSTVSAFLIRAGECKPEDRKFAEPPPEPSESATEPTAAPAPPPARGPRKPPTLKRP
jgi:hypothetical protein